MWLYSELTKSIVNVSEMLPTSCDRLATCFMTARSIYTPDRSQLHFVICSLFYTINEMNEICV